MHGDFNPETYAQEQLNHGVSDKDQSNRDKATEAYKNPRYTNNYNGYSKERNKDCLP